jgi:mono/diheme cytochrome c family protein
MKHLITLPLLLVATNIWADTPLRSLVFYSAEARREQPNFTPDSERGRTLITQEWGVSQVLANCASCHTDSPAKAGRHAVTGKPIDALSPAITPNRFSNPKKVEKWFKRNCNEVLGRACTAAEKADFIKLAMESK